MKMNKLLIAAGVVCGFAGISGTALAQVNEITQPVTAEILAPTDINLVQDADMTFDATVSTNAEQVVAAIPAAYTVTGDDRAFTIDTSGSSTELTLPPSSAVANDGSTMPFTQTASANSGVIVDGTADFTVDGEITVAANQPVGVYEGDLVVTVAYE